MGLERRLINQIPGLESPFSGRSNRFPGKAKQRKYCAKEIDRRRSRILSFSAAICYLWRRAKAFFISGTSYRAGSRALGPRIERQVMLVDPYFSVPVIPVSKV